MRNTAFLPFALIAFISCLGISASAQPLVTYGNRSINKEDFLKAYQKNNTEKKPTEKSYRDYLELYIRYKLKVQAATDLKLDTLPNQLGELQNFRNQVVENYMSDQTSLDQLVEEAFTRSQKDIHLNYIYVAAPPAASAADTLKAYKKISDAYADLKGGKDFGETATAYSDDPFAKSNHGDMGFVTVFSLPYELETLAYTVMPSKFSKIYRSKSGYLIFKNVEERKALGRMHTAQILLAFPPDAVSFSKNQVKNEADSVYSLLNKGGDFKKTAESVSGDNLTYQTGGDMPEFGVGKYGAAFENAAFALQKDGDISQPVLTSFGYHIIMRLAKVPVSAEKNKATLDALKQRVLNDPRIEVTKKAMSKKIMTVTHFKRNPLDEKSLWDFTDNSLLNKPSSSITGIDNKTILFSFTKKDYTVQEWIDYRKNLPASIGKGKTNNELMNLYTQAAVFEYYREHAEEYDKDFAYQLNEFKEGNLLFEIMQRQVWNKAASDSVGLQRFYESAKTKYWWDASADAIIFTSGNQTAADNFTAQLKNHIGDWRKLTDSSNGLIQADSGRFELSQLPMMGKGNSDGGQFSAFVKNQNDNSVTFAYIIKPYNERAQRTYREARGFVINDYQVFLEDKWIAELKKKYPVKINETVLKGLPK